VGVLAFRDVEAEAAGFMVDQGNGLNRGSGSTPIRAAAAYHRSTNKQWEGYSRSSRCLGIDIRRLPRLPAIRTISRVIVVLSQFIDRPSIFAERNAIEHLTPLCDSQLSTYS
jgi:hypothetical protein